MEYQITGKTVLTGLLGSPVSHSISPLMHNEGFRLLNLDYAYLCFDIKEAQLKDTLKGLRLLNVRGFNCTMPLKTQMHQLADRLSPAASLIGAVNTVVNDNGVFTGHNTDGIGYMMALKDQGLDIQDKTMTLLGVGGASTAICVQAALDGAKKIHIFNRKSPSWNHGLELARTIQAQTGCDVTLFDIHDLTQLKASLEVSHVLTNGTPLGMSPKEDICPIPSDLELPSSLLVSDIIYNPRQTILMEQAVKYGCKAFNGLYMLLYQGAEAFRLWTGEDMPVDMIREKYFR